MILRFKRIAALLAVSVMVTSIVVGCSKADKLPTSNTTPISESNNTKAPDKASEDNNTETSEKPSENNETETPDKPSEGKTTEDSDVKNNPSNTPAKSDSQEVLLKDMMKLAEQGKVINSEFAVKTTDIAEVEKKLGKAEQVNWISEAKGNYVDYPKYNLAFGFNKGSQIFEARSFDSKLKNISLSMAKKAYGKPAYDVKANGEEIIGYTAGQEFKILLVFKAPSSSNKNPSLDHYSVLYPRGTVNMMADDPGREW